MTHPSPALDPAAIDPARARAASLARRFGRGLLRAARALGALAWRRRAALRAVLVRVAWWGALAAWWTTALALVGGGVLDIRGALVVFGTGALVCAGVVGLGGARRVRWWGGALGSVHGTSAVVLWFVANA